MMSDGLLVLVLVVHLVVLQVIVVVHLMVVEVRAGVVMGLAALNLLVHELLEQGDHLLALRVPRHHVSAEQGHNLRVGHFLIVEGVHRVKQLLDLLLLSEHAHTDNQRPELRLVQHTILVQVEPFEVLIELEQESLVLLQLEVEYDFLEVGIDMFGQLLVSIDEPLVDLFSRHFAWVLLVLLQCFLVAIFNHVADLLL